MAARPLNGETALITGASSGIGFACAELFAERGMRLILNARREEKLKEIAADLRRQYGVESHLLPFDVSDRKAAQTAIRGLPAEWRSVDVLLNNAGLARGLAPLQESDEADWDDMIETNVRGLLTVTRAVVPGMVEQKRGHVINLGSIAGHEVYPRGGVYCATKHAVRALTQGLRIDLLGTGVRVTSIDPGMVETDFSVVRFRGDVERADAVYQKFVPLSARDVANAVIWCVEQPPHVNVNEVILMPTHQATVAHSYLPKGGRAQAEEELRAWDRQR